MKPYQLVPLLFALLFLAACGAVGDEIVLGAAPWQDGESSEYDVIGAQGERVGTAVWQWHTTPTGWQQTYTVTLPSRVDSGLMLLGHDLLPRTSEMERGGVAYATSYDDRQITINTTAADGTTSSSTINRSGLIIDNDQSLQVQRALPLADGYAAHYRGLVANTGAQFTTNLRVIGAESVTTPAGTFETWHVTMTTAGATHDAWYAQEPPHLLVKYHNRAAGSQFLLRGWQETAAAAWQGSADDTFVPETSTETAAAEVNYLLAAVMLLFQFPLMILFPLLLGGWIKRRYGISWTVFGVGALTFILSQVGHIPFNWATGLLTGGWGIGLWPLPLLALAAGLSAGLFEEVARWLVLRYWLKQARGW
ncbi:MAG: YhfC family glutamic-type intramembrane protease, partial [Chloroflexota bacterium]